MVIELQFIGGGNMAEALLGGVLQSGVFAPEDIAVVEISEARADYLRDTFRGITVLSEPVQCSGLLLATKPQHVIGAMEAASEAGFNRALSIAAGLSTATLDAAAGEDVPVVRAMPNTPSLVGEGAAAVCAGASAGDADIKWATSILGAVGLVEVVDEGLMDAVTGLSGSGPAYVFMISEAMTEAGVLRGLPRDVASRLAHHTILGAGRMLTESESEPHELRAAVTSPGGTTAAGLAALERRALRSTIIEAVSASADRSAEMG